mmetsp:Transcript_715/g.863  ORF Transcript_715/g.863 Transcript_715/m.863 type:complete len:257 (-) Transcript_715:1034-1804(-)
MALERSRLLAFVLFLYLGICPQVAVAGDSDIATGRVFKEGRNDHVLIELESTTGKPTLRYEKRGDISCHDMQSNEANRAVWRCKPIRDEKEFVRCPILQRDSQDQPEFFLESLGVTAIAKKGSSISCRDGIEFQFTPPPSEKKLMDNFSQIAGGAAGLVFVIVWLFYQFCLGKKKSKKKSKKKGKRSKSKSKKRDKRDSWKKYLDYYDDYYTDSEDDYYYSEEEMPYLRGQSATRGRDMNGGSRGYERPRRRDRYY